MAVLGIWVYLLQLGQHFFRNSLPESLFSRFEHLVVVVVAKVDDALVQVLDLVGDAFLVLNQVLEQNLVRPESLDQRRHANGLVDKLGALVVDAS